MKPPLPIKLLVCILGAVFGVRVLYYFMYHPAVANNGATRKAVISTTRYQQSRDIHVVVLSSPPADAVCLDGSAPGYVVRRGVLSQKWIVFLQGGGWCMDAADCEARASTSLGSSRSWPADDAAGFFTGLRSSNRTVNPWMHHWSVVVFRYCDGLSFAGDRGRRILETLFRAVAETEYGFLHAGDIVLSGSSAGALALLLHSASIRQMPWFPSSARVREIYDSPIFLDDADDPVMNSWTEQQLAPVRFFSGLRQRFVDQAAGNIGKFSAVAAIRQLIATASAEVNDAERLPTVPRFFFQSVYDTWSLQHVVQLPCAMKGPAWQLAQLCDDVIAARKLVLVHAKTVQAVAELWVAGTPDGSASGYLSGCACHGFTKHGPFFVLSAKAYHAFDHWWSGRSDGVGVVTYDDVARQLNDQLHVTAAAFCPNRSFIKPLDWETGWKDKY